MAVTIVGLGPGDGRLLTREAWERLAGAETIYLRTSRHPAVADLPPGVRTASFDHLYESADSFAEVYEQIVAELLALARSGQEVVYAVPGHPFIGEATATALAWAAFEAGVPVEIIAGLSFVEPTLTAVAHDGLDGLQLFDALDIARVHYPPINPDIPLMLGQVYNRALAADVKLTLMIIYPDEHEVALVHGAATDDEMVEWLPLYAIDRSEHIDHLTSLCVPPLPYSASLNALAQTVAVLRGPDGCPWDQEQTPRSMRPTFLEEAYETLAAIDADDPTALREELGDLLYHIVMQVQMASEEEAFRLTEVVAGIDAKIKRRHPHVWGDRVVADSAEVLRNWEAIKRAEKGAGAGDERPSLLDDIPDALPALIQSEKIQGRVAGVGFDWADLAGVIEKVEEEMDELRTAVGPDEQAAELGDLLFIVVNWARRLGVDAETALGDANRRFSRRFRRLEQLAGARGLDLEALDLAGMERLWQEVKAGEDNN